MNTVLVKKVFKIYLSAEETKKTRPAYLLINPANGELFFVLRNNFNKDEKDFYLLLIGNEEEGLEFCEVLEIDDSCGPVSIVFKNNGGSCGFIVLPDGDGAIPMYVNQDPLNLSYGPKKLEIANFKVIEQN